MSCDDLDFTAQPDSAFQSRGVAFTSNAPAGSKLTWNFGDGAASTRLNPHHVYRHSGEFTAALYATAPGCAQEKARRTRRGGPRHYLRTGSVHLARGEEVSPDSVNNFLAHALLIQDKPQVSKTDPNSDAEGCGDSVVAAGKSIRKAVAKAGTKQHKNAKRRGTVLHTVHTLDVPRLAGKHGTYSVKQSVPKYTTLVGSQVPVTFLSSCKKGHHKTRSSSSSGVKSEAADDGYTLSLAAAPTPLPGHARSTPSWPSRTRASASRCSSRQASGWR